MFFGGLPPGFDDEAFGGAASEGDFEGEDSAVAKVRRIWRSTPPVTQCYVGASMALTAAAFALNGNAWPRLLELDLSGCGALTAAGLAGLPSEAPLLAKLRVTVNAQLRAPKLACPWLRSATLAICGRRAAACRAMIEPIE